MDYASLSQAGIAAGVGAVIGYVTNALAIRMLFRPYRTLHVFGLRVPFTPGIIPKQRDRLAASVGRMVAESLFGEASLRAHLGSDFLHEKLSAAIQGQIGVLQQTSPHGVAKGTGDSRTADMVEAVLGNAETRKRLLGDIFLGLVESPRFRGGLENLAQALGQLLSELRVEALLPDQGKRAAWLAGLGTPRPEGRRMLQRLAVYAVDDLLGREESIGDLLSPSFPRTVEGMVDFLYPHGRRLLMSWLSVPSTKQELVRHGKRILKELVGTLSTTQKLLVGAVGYERRLEDMMPELVDKVLGELDSFLNSRAALDGLHQSVKREVAAFLGRSPREALEVLGLERRRVLSLVRYRLRSTEKQGTVLPSVLRALLSLGDKNRDRSLGSVAEAALGLPEGGLGALVAEKLVGWIDRPGVAPRIFHALYGVVERLVGVWGQKSAGAAGEGTPLAAPPPVPVPPASSLARDLAGATMRFLGWWLPPLVKEFDVETMVREQILAMNMRELEEAILGLARREFRWINILGALLGALIGMVQVVIRMVGG